MVLPVMHRITGPVSKKTRTVVNCVVVAPAESKSVLAVVLTSGV